MSDEPASSRLPSRRTVLKAGGAALGLGVAGVLGAEVLEEQSVPAPDTEAGDYEPAELAAQFAPDLHFGEYEQWFPTDPRPYVEERDGERVADGFAALNGYSGAYLETGEPPEPTVFYNVVEVTPALAAVQYWFYYAFDQFSVNFHWHDWELLQVFVDLADEQRESADGASGGTASHEAVLLSASAHARKVPNNEYLDPGDGDTVGVLSEAGSHASATTVNEESTTFQRTPLNDVSADITNEFVEAAASIGEFPLAYGLPRDEGGRLPFVVPELDGQPLYDHPDVEVGREAFVDEAATVRSLSELTEVPTGIPQRQHASTWTHEDGDGQGDQTYSLVPTSEVEDIDDFEGRQLSFEFAIPGFVEDQFASHITTTGTPWTQPRYEHPVDDVTDSRHREALAERYGLDDVTGGFADTVVGAVEELTSGSDGRLRGTDGSDDAVSAQASVSLSSTDTETLCLLESPDPTAVPTAQGVFGFVDVEQQEHRLTVNGPGYAPRSERVSVKSGVSHPGVEGNVTLVRDAAAVKVRGDPGDTELARVRLSDDFAGTVYDAKPGTDGRFAVYTHREGTYSLEVEDRQGDRGAYRIDPDDEDAVTVEIETGQASLAGYLVPYLAESARLAREFDEGEASTRTATETGRESAAAKFDSAESAAAQAAEFAAEGKEKQANEQLSTVIERLGSLVEFLRSQAGGKFSPAVVDLLVDRAEHAREKAETAKR